MQSIPISAKKSSTKTVMRSIVASFSDELVKNLLERDDLREPFRTAVEDEWDRRFFDSSASEDEAMAIDPDAFLNSFNACMTKLIKEAECNGKPPEALMTFKLDSNRKFYDAA